MEDSKNIGGVDGQTPVVGANSIDINGIQEGLAQANDKSADPIEQGIPTPLKISGKPEINAPVASPKQQVAPVAVPTEGKTTSARVSPLADMPANASAGDSSLSSGKTDGAVAMQAPSPTQLSPSTEGDISDKNPQPEQPEAPNSPQTEKPPEVPPSPEALPEQPPEEPEGNIEDDEVDFGDPLVNIRKNEPDDDFERNPLAQMKRAGEFLKTAPGRMRIY